MERLNQRALTGHAVIDGLEEKNQRMVELGEASKSTSAQLKTPGGSYYCENSAGR